MDSPDSPEQNSDSEASNVSWRSTIWLRVAAIVMALLWFWAFGQLMNFTAAPNFVRTLLVVAWLVGTGATVWRMRGWRALGVVFVWILAVQVLWYFQRPSNDRSWNADQANLPTAEINGTNLTIHNVRNTFYRSESDFDVLWETRTYDLNKLETVDFIVEPFTDWRGLAHVFLTFGFSDGEHVAVSVEIRKERGESYSPMRGLFRQYEVMYVVGDERDLIGLRANHRHDPVHLYPARTSRVAARELLESMLDHANRLAEHPEFYNSLTNTCATNVVDHLEAVSDHRVFVADYRLIFPGYADELAEDMGLLAIDGRVEDVRDEYLINDRAATADMSDGKAWSRAIRTVK